jgi:hypothetical protein
MVRREGLPQLPLHRQVFGLRGFVVNIINVDFQLAFGVYFTDIDRPPAQGASLSTSSTSTFSFVFDIFFTDVDRTPA